MSIADAAMERDAIRLEARNLLEALKCQFDVDESLARNGIHAYVKEHPDRTTLELRRGEEGDTDFANFSVGISHEGSLFGPWDGRTNVRPGVSFLSDEGIACIQRLESGVVHAFNIRV